ncbi:DUF1428 domain-containing protein [Brachymonas denitrificans]|uniref:DUF1428 domain-containing protein n=1 Tax=Brachymonas denitrificans TaxID=28220 RepID=UPI002AFDFA48|nr:DUF1428 domain-containing protein [Brachymonas denitrificans]
MQQGNYVDGFVVPVKTDEKEAYRAIADKAARIFMRHGAVEVVECWADDVKPGKHTSFPQAVHLKDSETVVFAWIVWPTRELRDRGMQAAMEDPEMDKDPAHMPFDTKRMIFGGFGVLVNH